LKEECDDWYGRNLDAEQRDDGLKRVKDEERVALAEEELAETKKKLIELEQEKRKFTLDETHVNQYLPLMKHILISIYH
jgi:hypothetical protein